MHNKLKIATSYLLYFLSDIFHFLLFEYWQRRRRSERGRILSSVLLLANDGFSIFFMALTEELYAPKCNATNHTQYDQTTTRKGFWPSYDVGFLANKDWGWGISKTYKGLGDSISRKTFRYTFFALRSKTQKRKLRGGI